VKIGIGFVVAGCVTVIACVAMVTGHDGALMQRIVDVLAGIAIGAGVGVAEAKTSTGS